MSLSYGFKLTWDEFWAGQENNPNSEFTFLYNGNCYILLHWDDMISKCYSVLTEPIFKGKSFRDVIDDIIFEN